MRLRSRERRLIAAALAVILVAAAPGFDAYQAWAGVTQGSTPDAPRPVAGLGAPGAPASPAAPAALAGPGAAALPDVAALPNVAAVPLGAVMAPLGGSQAAAGPIAAALPARAAGSPGESLSVQLPASRPSPEAAGEASQTTWGGWLRERVGLAASDPDAVVPAGSAARRGSAALAPSGARYLGLGRRVYDEDVIAAQKRDPRPVVAFDLNETLERHDDKTNPDKIRVHPHAIEALAALKTSGLKVVMWTQAEQWWVEKFFATDEGRELLPYFDLVITAENYMGMTAAEQARLPETARRVARDAAAKDLSVLGYSVLIDNRRAAKAVADDAGFTYLPVTDLPDHPTVHDNELMSAVNEVLAVRKVSLLDRTPDGEEIAVLDSARAKKFIDPDGLRFFINRGPFAFTEEGIKRAAGGAAPAIYSALQRRGGVVFAAAMTPAERALARHDKVVRIGDNIWLRYLDVPKLQFEDYYTGFSNSLAWPVLHGLGEVFYGDTLPYHHTEHEAYRAVNAMFAADFARLLGERSRGPLLIQDYHLLPLSGMLRGSGAQGITQQFLHIPWASPEYLRETLPPALLREIVEGMLGNDIVGFHTRIYARNFLETVAGVMGQEAQVDFVRGTIRYQGREIWARAYPISIDVGSVLKAARSERALAEMRRLEALKAGRKLFLRVDRMDPTKGILEGFKAYRQMLRDRPAAVGRTLFYAILQPSRDANFAYSKLQKDIRALIDEINAEFRERAGGDVIEARLTGAPLDEVVAAQAIMDVGVVNALADGMNLVAKEMALLSDPALRADLRRAAGLDGPALPGIVAGLPGVLSLSSQLGAFQELGPLSVVISDPTDTEKTSHALAAALIVQPQWNETAAAAAGQVREHDLQQWLEAMLRDIQARAAPPDPTSGPGGTRWEKLAVLMTNGATAAFVVGLAPQVWTNIMQLMAGSPALLLGIPWMAFAIGTLSSFLLLFDAVKRKGAAQIVLQVNGILMQMAVLATLFAAQLMLPAGSALMIMPVWAAAALFPLFAAGLAAALLKRYGHISDAAWKRTTRAGELMVLGALAQALWTPFAGSLAYMLPAAVAVGAGWALRRLQAQRRLPPPLRRALRWSRVVFGARLGVVMYGLPALAYQNWANPGKMAIVDLRTIVANMIGNLLSLPQAWLKKDKVLSFKSFWDGIIGTGVVLSLAASFGVISVPLFASIFGAVAAFLAAITFAQARHGRPAPPAAAVPSDPVLIR